MTACFSILTAYGAAIALVKPKDAQADILVLLPFALLGLGAVAGLVGKAAGVKLGGVETVGEANREVTNAVGFKRNAAYAAVALAFLGVAVAGYVVFASYGNQGHELIAPSAGAARY